MKEWIDRIRKLEQQARDILRAIGGTKDTTGFSLSLVRVGVLNATMARNGTAAVSWNTVDVAGGLDADTGYDFTVVDVGQIPAAVSPLPSGTTVTCAKVGSVWVLIAYDCDNI